MPTASLIRSLRETRARPWEPRPARHDVDVGAYGTLAAMLALCAAAGVLVSWLRGDWRVGALAALIGIAGVATGALLGARVWPALGVRVASAVLRLYARHGRRVGSQLLLTPYPDFVPGRLRQAWESTAFAGALALAVSVNVLVLLDSPPAALWWLSLACLALCCIGTVLLVPHWTFARLGLRISSQGRFVVRSVAESYTGFVRVSNGTVLVGAVFYGATVMAIRATRLEGYLTVAATLLLLLAVGGAMMATAVAFFRSREEDVLRAIAGQARRVGFHTVRDGRVASI